MSETILPPQAQKIIPKGFFASTNICTYGTERQDRKKKLKMVAKVIINNHINMPPQSSCPVVWDSDLDDEMVMDSHSVGEMEPHIIDDHLDVDDFLIIGDEVEDDTSLGLEDDDMGDEGVFSRDTMFRPDPPATPPPQEETFGLERNYDVREVTPEFRKEVVKMDVEDVRLPGLEELREEYSLSCKRLGETIWHAEMTRRWRARFSVVDDASENGQALEKAQDFLTGARSTLTKDLEDSRRKLWAMIHARPPTQF